MDQFFELFKLTNGLWKYPERGDRGQDLATRVNRFFLLFLLPHPLNLISRAFSITGLFFSRSPRVLTILKNGSCSRSGGNWSTHAFLCSELISRESHYIFGPPNAPDTSFAIRCNVLVYKGTIFHVQLFFPLLRWIDSFTLVKSVVSIK